MDYEEEKEEEETDEAFETFFAGTSSDAEKSKALRALELSLFETILRWNRFERTGGFLAREVLRGREVRRRRVDTRGKRVGRSGEEREERNVRVWRIRGRSGDR